MDWVQLYQRLKAQAIALFASGRIRQVRVVRTEVIVKKEDRLWLLSPGFSKPYSVPDTEMAGGNPNASNLPPIFHEPPTRPLLPGGGDSAIFPEKE